MRHAFWILLGLLNAICIRGAVPSPANGFSHTALSVPAEGRAGFTRLEASALGIGVTNRLSSSLSAQNQILLNGSGVAAGDVDGDGLCDLYFCTLTEGNHLYRNLGQWKFADMTTLAGVACEGQFSSGTCLVDLDGDEDLDLLVNSIGGGTRLFLNDGRGKFIEKTDAGFLRRGGSHSIAVADVDGDGDLDVYVTNYRTTTVRDNPIRVRLRQVNGRLVVPPPHEDRFLVHVTAPGKGSLIELGEADVLYRNEGNGTFTPIDWSGGGFFLDESAQPFGKPPLDWGLSALFSDLNGDGLPDLYVCNDFSSPDRLWFGNQQHQLQAAPSRALRHTSWASMSVDVADLDHDGYPELFVSDMLSASLNRRQTQKGNSSPAVQPEDEAWDRPQYLRNMLFWNQGDGTFREMAPFAGVEASEWTWGAAFLDVDLDGYDDLLLATGHGADMQDFDAAERIAQLRMKEPQLSAVVLMTNYPALNPPNVAFRNRGNLTFEPAGSTWGFNRPGITHGVILADLDNDGDLDVVTSDLNQSPGLYRNESNAPRIAVRLKSNGKQKNTHGIGARIRLLTGKSAQQKEVVAGGRYLSSDEPTRCFAANWAEGETAELEVRWPGGEISRINSLQRNQLYVVDGSASRPAINPAQLATPSKDWFEALSPNPFPVAPEAPSEEAVLQPLLPFPLSPRGTGCLVFDVDQDGFPDLVLGAARGKKPSFWLNHSGRSFECLPASASMPELSGDVSSMTGFVISPEETCVLMAVARDENNETAGSAIMEFRIRRRELSGTTWTDPIPMTISTLVMSDVDGDGDLDVFVAGRCVPRRYPDPAPAQWFRNESGRFIAERFGLNTTSLGLMTGAVVADLTRDGRPDLVVATEWGTLKFFVNSAQGFVDRTEASGLSNATGLWTCMIAVDLDHDGVPELVVGNQGRNQMWNRFLDNPLRLYYGDFNQSGSWATLLAVRPPGFDRYFPLNDLNTLKRQVPRLGQLFASHSEFAQVTIDKLFEMAQVAEHHVEANHFEHGVFRLKGQHFEFVPLPMMSQLSVVNAMGTGDFNGDGHPDLILAQNGPAFGPDMVRQDAGSAMILIGDGHGGLTALRSQATGLHLIGSQTSVATADWDRDGRSDLVIGEVGRPPRVFLNRTKPLPTKLTP